MNTFIFLAPNWLWLLSLMPLWLVIIFYSQQQSRLDLQSFRSIDLKKNRQYLPQILMLITLLALIIALAKPAWDPQPKSNETQGSDMVFLLDVSRSMLVNDARPNRLEVARQAIRNTINASTSDRFGLVVFAGSTSIQSPLTNDKTFFNYLLDQVSSLSVAQGGTRIEDALFKVLDKMSEKNQQGVMDIILISDGEDLGSQPERALTRLNELGARLIVIGLGDSDFGGRIPNRQGDGWQVYQGQEIWSKMHTDKLRNLAQGAEQGLFIPVGTATFDLVKIREKLQHVWPNTKHKKGEELTYQQGYPYCLYLALFAQLLGWLRGRHVWLTGLLLFSFNSQAITELGVQPSAEVTTEINAKVNADNIVNTLSSVDAPLANISDINESETFIDTSTDALSKLSTQEQFLLAQSLFEESPEHAAEVYRYIAEQTQQSAVAIQANFNLATSLIYYAEHLTQQLSLPDAFGDNVAAALTDKLGFKVADALPGNSPKARTEQLNNRFDDEHEFFDDDDYIDPEFYYEQAADILRTVLQHSPSHSASQQNLEWLMLRNEAQKKSDKDQSPDQQKSAESQQSESKEKPEQQQESDQEQNKADEKQAAKSQQSQQNETSAVQLSDLSLPAPQTSAEEILKQAKVRNLTERAPQSKKQTQVERDW